MGFEPDPKIEQIAEAYALDAVDFARDQFRIALDWSDSSVESVESILKILHEQMARAKPSPDRVFQFAKVFGSYVGEVFRRNHGGLWGMVRVENETFPGMQADRTKAEFWPWGKVRNRIVNGPEDNVWHYFQALISQDG